MTRWQRRLACLLACLPALVATTACGSDRDPVTPSPDESVLARSVVDLRVRGCGPQPVRGTGTVIDRDGLVVTAAHVVAGAETIEATDIGGTPVGAAVVYFDPAADIAAIRLTEPRGTPAPVSSEVAAGDEGVVALVGGDGAVELVDIEVLRRVTIATTDIYLDADVERAGFEIDARIEPGDSGAMVHLTGGGAGIVWARSTVRSDHAWAVRLPDALTDAASRAALATTVDPGPCT